MGTSKQTLPIAVSVAILLGSVRFTLILPVIMFLSWHFCDQISKKTNFSVFFPKKLFFSRIDFWASSILSEKVPSSSNVQTCAASFQNCERLERIGLGLVPNWEKIWRFTQFDRKSLILMPVNAQTLSNWRSILLIECLPKLLYTFHRMIVVCKEYFRVVWLTVTLVETSKLRALFWFWWNVNGSTWISNIHGGDFPQNHVLST